MEPAPALVPGVVLRLRVAAAALDQSVDFTTMKVPFAQPGAKGHAQSIKGPAHSPLLGPSGEPCETWGEALAAALEDVVQLLDRHASTTAAALDIARLRGEFDAFTKTKAETKAETSSSVAGRPSIVETLSKKFDDHQAAAAVAQIREEESDGDDVSEGESPETPKKKLGPETPKKKPERRPKIAETPKPVAKVERLTLLLEETCVGLDAFAADAGTELGRRRTKKEVHVADARDAWRGWELAAKFVEASGVEELSSDGKSGKRGAAAAVRNEERKRVDRLARECKDARELAAVGARTAARLDAAVEEVATQMRAGFATRGDLRHVEAGLERLVQLQRGTADAISKSQDGLTEYEADLQALADQLRASNARTPRYARLERLLDRKADLGDLDRLHEELGGKLDEVEKGGARALMSDDGGLSGALNVKCLACNRPWCGAGVERRSRLFFAASPSFERRRSERPSHLAGTATSTRATARGRSWGPRRRVCPRRRGRRRRARDGASRRSPCRPSRARLLATGLATTGGFECWTRRAAGPSSCRATSRWRWKMRQTCF